MQHYTYYMGGINNMKNVNIYIPEELIAMSQRNPFQKLNNNNTQNGLENTREVVTVIFTVKVSAASAAAAAAAASGGPSSLKSSKL